MSQRRISMKKIREIIRFYEHPKLSQRHIAQALGVSHPVDSNYIMKIKTSGLVYNGIKNRQVLLVI